MLNTIFNKLLFLLLFVILSFIIGFFLYVQHEKTKADFLLSQAADDKGRLLDKFLDLKSKSLKTFAYDYTFYDEMVTFIKTGNKKWAKENIDPGLETFKTDVVWIYKADLSLLYTVNNLEGRGLKEIPVPKPSFKVIFEKDKLPHFFVKTEFGFMEIAGGTIHPTFDKDRKTEPKGYFFAGRFWDAEYLKEISALTDSTLEMLPYNGEAPQAFYDKESNKIIASRIFTQWDGAPIAFLSSKSHMPISAELKQSYNIGIFSLALFSVLILSTTVFFIFRWIIQPLRQISTSLKSGDPSLLNLRQDALEFRTISQLIRNFFAQRDNLFKEILERKEAQKKLLDTQARLKALFELSPEAIYLISPNGMIIDCNPTATQMTGYLKEELIVMNMFNVLAEEKSGKTSEKIDMRTIIDHSFNEHLCRRKDGSVFPLEINAKSIEIDKKGFFIVTARDITQKRKTEDELTKARQLESLGILAGGIAHDFNNILTGIIGNISLARYYALPGDKISERLIIAENAAEKAKGLTQQLLTFSKGGTPIKNPESIREILFDSAQFLLSGKNIKSNYDLPDDLWMIEADIAQISQVINNLIINAIDAMPEGGSIDIDAKNIEIDSKNKLPVPPGRYVKITVRDYGCGIPEKHLSRIFEPYYTTKKSGNGMGLAIVYSIIKRHKGYITVESTEGGGTTFVFYLRAVAAAAQGSMKKQDSKNEVVKKSGRILVMDDEETIREVLAKLLKHMGYDVQYAAEGGEAIELYENALSMGMPFDAVIMDLTVPGGMGGREAIKALLKIDSEAKVIVTSGYSNDPVLANYKEYGFLHILKKPFTANVLIEVLSKVETRDANLN